MTIPPISVKVEVDSSGAITGVKTVKDEVSSLTTATSAATAKSSKLSGAFSSLGKVSNSTRGKIQNVSFQMQDIIVQLQNGTSKTVALSQQLPQLAGAFGAVGAAIGVGVALGIPALSLAFQALNEETVSYEDALDGLKDAVDRYRGAVDATLLSQDELSARFGSAADDARTTLALLEQIARSEAQRSIDNISQSLADMMGIAGDGDNRAALAEFFDVNIFLAFNEGQREAREQARLLTSEYQSFQDELNNANGDIDAQISAMQGMVGAANELANATGGVTEEEDALLKKLNETLVLMYEQRGAVEDTRIETGNFVLGLYEAVSAAISVSESLDGPKSSIQTMADSAWSFANGLWESAKANAAFDASLADGTYKMMRAYEAYGESRGKAPSVAPSSAARGGAGAGTGGSEADPFTAAFEQLQEQLKTASELELEAYEDSQATLEEALERKKLTQEEYNEQMLRLQKQHADEMTAIDAYRYGDTLSQTQAFFGDMATAFSSGNDKLAVISQAAAKVEALINAGRAYAQVAADPSLPWFAKIPAAASVFSAISGVASAAGIGSGTTSTATSDVATEAESSVNQYVQVSIAGDTVGISTVEQLFDKINEGLADDRTFKGIQLV